MSNNPRKRQKTSSAVKSARVRLKGKLKTNVQPLGAAAEYDVHDDANKDDEERRLESILFGTKYTPRDGALSGLGDESDEEALGDFNIGAGRAMDAFLDQDLFFIDDGSNTGPNPYESGRMQGSASSEVNEDVNSGHDSDSSSSSRPSFKPPSKTSKTGKPPPAWTDPADIPLQVPLTAARQRKLRDAPSETALSGREYESRLRRQFERLHAVPQWAQKPRIRSKMDRKRRDSDTELDVEEDDIDISHLLNSTSGITGLDSTERGNKKKTVLPAGTVSIERLRDANQSIQAKEKSMGAINVVTFHPSDRVPVLCVASSDRRVRLFNIDGHTSPLLQTLHIPTLPLPNQSSALFHPSGNSILFTGPRPFFYTHDLQSGTTTQHARGLWGASSSSFHDPTTSLSMGTSRKRSRAESQGGGKRGPDRSGTGSNTEGLGITQASFEPTTGSLLAVAGGRGAYVHLVDWTAGAGQVVGSLKCGSGGGVKGMWWVPPRTTAPALGDEDAESSARTHLAVLTGDAEVYLWDVGERKCVRRWTDEGGFRGAGRALAGAGHDWLALGSNSGLVNVYGSSAISSSDITNPKPIKTIGNLTTAISALKFNHDAQVLAVASKEKKDSMRLIHLPSLTSFANWPTSSTPLGHVTALDFSARSEYLAIGNTRGRVLLYHLRDYGVGGSLGM